MPAAVVDVDDADFAVAAVKQPPVAAAVVAPADVDNAPVSLQLPPRLDVGVDVAVDASWPVFVQQVEEPSTADVDGLLLLMDSV